MQPAVMGQRLSFDDSLWATVTAITERMRGRAMIIAGEPG
jgi:hypothetical protein